jgi:hypothetical protein
MTVPHSGHKYRERGYTPSADYTARKCVDPRAGRL